MILAELDRWDEKTDEYRELLADWWGVIETRRGELASWSWPEFWQIVLRQNTRVRLPSRQFVEDWVRQVLAARSLEELLTGDAARGLVTARERRLKRSLARVDNTRARELWRKGEGKAGTDQLDLRWRAARGILSDILVGLEADDDAVAE